MMAISPLAGKPAMKDALIDIKKLLDAYYSEIPDQQQPAQRVAFGTSGHRGCSFDKGFNEWHILAISQAICDYRKQAGITGPLFLGIDTHALSKPALISAIEVLAANEVSFMLDAEDDYTPTPVISHSILTYNFCRKEGLADGIVITPSHNPPKEGGFKYNPPHGGPAEGKITTWIEVKANGYLANKLQGIKRIPYETALKSSLIKRYDYKDSYIGDLGNVLDMESISQANISLAVDPLGGAGIHYWKAIADRYRLNLTVINDKVDPTFSFMTLDWDGQIRMDPSSPYAMQSLIALKDRFSLAFACDTDHDRHGIVTKSCGLMPSNHYLSAAIDYLFRHRPNWPKRLGIGKTLVSSCMIDRVADSLGRPLYEVLVGFKWFVEGLMQGSLGFVGEESAGATFVRTDGRVWTTDKDGILMSLLAAEITARLGKDPALLYKELEQRFGSPAYERIEAPITLKQKEILKEISKQKITLTKLAGEPIEAIMTHLPSSGAAIGGIKVSTANSWFAARPSGTENIYKIYAETLEGKDHLKVLLAQAQEFIDKTLSDVAS